MQDDQLKRLERENARLRARVAELEATVVPKELQRLAEQIPDNIMVLDRDERIRYINWTVPDLTVEQVIGTEPYDYVPDEHKDSLRASYRSVLETGEPSRVETRYAAEDGSQSAWETRAVPLRHGGEIDGIVIVSTNISERDAAAAKLRQSQKMELVGQLAGGIAHDFNNLLLAVLLNNELAARAAEDPLVTERLDESKMAIERAVELTRQLLTFGRRQPVRFENLDLNVLVCNMIKILSRTLPETIALRFEPTDDAAIVRADCGQIEQILLNLCINARDAIDKTGTIRIATARMARNDGDGDRTEIRLSITDDGKGMAPEVRDRVFEPFFTTKGPGQGTGLGLAMVYGIVEKHGGSIAVESQPDQGTAFHVQFPAAQGKVAPVVQTPAGAMVAGRGRGETILVAEDAAHVQRVVVQLLEDSGYRVVTASDGGEAVVRVRELGDRIALALLDVVMPVMSGPEVAAQIRERHPAIRVLFTSGYSDDAVTGAVDASAILRKPYEPTRLLRRIRDELDGGAGESRG